MDEAEARERLTRMVAADDAPVLDADALDDLLAQGKRADAAGRLPSSSGWDPTWDLNYAAAAGWDLKAAAIASGGQTTGPGGALVESEQLGSYSYQAGDAGRLHDHCLQMAKRYRRGAVAVGTTV